MDEKDVKILLVEDEESVASFVKTELEFEDYQVVWAEDGKKALDLFTQEKPTLILLDWMLPVYDGMTGYGESASKVMSLLLCLPPKILPLI